MEPSTLQYPPFQKYGRREIEPGVLLVFAPNPGRYDYFGDSDLFPDQKLTMVGKHGGLAERLIAPVLKIGIPA